MTNEELIQKLNEAHNEGFDVGYWAGRRDYEKKWIPCSQKLPEENGQYLITVKYVHVDGYDDIYAEHGEWTDGKWDMFCFGHCGEVESVLAWMPLPKQYEGRTEEWK